MSKPSKSKASFRVEGLESRILLSAVPMDGAVDPVEEPLVLDSVLIQDQAASEASSDSGSELYAAAEAMAPGEVYLSGEIAAGSVIEAEVIFVADGTVLDGVQLSADRVELGGAIWSGNSLILADKLNVLADQASEPGAVLTVAPRSTEAAIALGFDDVGFALDEQDMAHFAAAEFDELIVGQEDGAYDFVIDGLAYVGDLLLRSPNDGGEFYILSQIQHSGGTLRYHGSGQTQNTSADTVTSGNDILVDDSLQLVYIANNGNTFGDNTFYFDTTNGGLSPEGGDILISGSILGSNFEQGGTLYLNAGTTGNILIQGGVGTLEALERIVIVNANDVTFKGDVILDSFEQEAGSGETVFGTTTSNFVRVNDGDFVVQTEKNITFNSDVESTSGNVELGVNSASTSGKVWFKGNVDLDDGDLIVTEAKDFEITGTATIVGTLQQLVGSRDAIFRDGVTAQVIELTANREIRFLDTVTLTAGDMTLVSNDIDFDGGVGSVIGALDSNDTPLSSLYLRPTAANLNMDIGDPTGGTATFTLSSTDIAALADDFALIAIGFHDAGVTSTNAVRIGNAFFLDAVAVYGGSFLVNGSFRARTSLLIDADSGLIDVDNTQIRVTNEQLESVWQSSELELLAHTGNILFRNGASLLIDNNDPADADEGSNIRLTATAGSITNQAGSFGFVESRDLTATAAQSITLLTNVENVSAYSTSAGSITIDELDGLHVVEAITANGAIAFSSGGDTVIDLIESETDALANTVTVEVFGGDLLVDRILAGTLGDVELNVEGALTGVVSPANPPHVTGNALTLNTEDGIGVSTNPLQILANSLDADNSELGLVYIQQNSGRATVSVEIDNQSVTSGDYVAFTVLGVDASVDGNGITSASDAGILIDSAGSLAINASVSSEGGAITVDAVNAITLGSGVIVDSNGGDVVITSTSDLTLAADASIESLGGAIVAVVGGNVLAGRFDARSADLEDRSTWGSMTLEADGYIHDYSGDAAGNLFANNLKLSAGTGIGEVPNGATERALEINAVTLAAVSDAGDVALRSLADVSIATTPVLNSQTLNTNGSAGSGPAITSLVGLQNLGGGEILLISDALLSTSAAVTTAGTGRLVVVGDSITLGSTLSSAGGALSFSATNDLILTDDASVSTSGTADVLFVSDSGSVLAAAGSSVASGGSGAVVISANQNVTLGIVTTTGEIGLEATNGSILSASGGDDARTVLTGDTLSIIADGSVAGADGSTDALLTTVNTLSLDGGDGAIHKISNSSSLTVGTTSASVVRYDSLLSGVVFTVDSGSDVAVSGTGDIDLAITSGDFVLSAANEISTTGAGAIQIDAAGTFSMGVASDITNVNGSIDILAGGTASISQVVSVDGAITVTSTAGSIIDSDPLEAANDFETAGQLTLSASTGIGIESNDRQTLSVLLGTLNATTNTGGIYVTSTESFATNGLTTETSGTISILSEEALTIGKDSVGMAINSAAGLVLAAGTSLTQEADGTITAAEDIVLSAGTDSVLFSVSTPGSVALNAGGSVMGYANPSVVAIDADGLLLQTVGSVGLPTQRLAMDVNSLAGVVTSGTLAFDNASSLTLGFVSVSTIPVAPMGVLPSPVAVSGSTLTINSTLDSGVPVGSGLFATIDGDLIVASAGTADALAVTQALPVLWQTSGTQTWNGIFDYAGGTATLRSGDSITISATGAIRSNDGDLFVDATSDLTLATDGTIELTSGSSIQQVGGTITFAGALSTTGAIALNAGDSILAGTAGGEIRVTAGDLILTAGDGIGSDASALTTAVSRLSSFSSSLGTFIDNTGNVEVTNLGFAITSLTPEAVFNKAFSGYQGGVQTQLNGGIQFNNSGTVQVDPVQAVIRAYQGSTNEFALLLENAGPDANALSVLFEVIRQDGDTVDASNDPLTPDLRDGNPPTTSFDSESGVLRVFVRNGVSTMAEIVDAINAEADFSGSAIFVSGLEDGSGEFSIGLADETAFAAEGGAYEGLIAYDAGTTAGGLDPIAAVAEIQPGDALYSILVTSTNPGAAANNFTFRILDDGPAGRLTAGANEAVVEWDSVNGLLDVFINYGITTAGTIVDAINDAQTNDSVPFAAEFGGSFNASDVDDVIGDPSVLMVANLSPKAVLRPTGANNDFQVTATTAGPLYNGIDFRFIDDGSVSTQGVRAVFDGVNNIMSVYINSAQTTANQVIAALNTEGTFSGAIVAEASGGNTGAGAIQSNYFQLRGGAVSVNASVTVGLVGPLNDFVVTAGEIGADQNAIQVIIVSATEEDKVDVGSAKVAYDDINKILEIRVPEFTTAAAIIDVINAASLPLTASLPAGAAIGTGAITLASYPKTAGGTGSVARAVVNFEGTNNDFELVADSDSVLLQNIRAYVIDNGSITDGSASVSYDSLTRYLVINLQSGVTTANTVVTAINNASVPVGASHANGSDGNGTFGDATQNFVGGADPVVATLVTELPSGVTVELDSTIGGVVNNGIHVSYALDASLAAGTASATFFEADGLRLVQLRAADATTTLNALQAALDAALDVPFTIANIADIGAEVVGELAPVSATANEGAIQLTATDSISLIGRVASETGSVSITTTPAGDLTFDAVTTSIVTIDGIDLNLAGAFVNNASLEDPLLKVYDEALLRISTGALDPSSEDVVLDTNGSIEILGSGFSLTDSDITAEAGDSILIDAAINAASVSTMTLTAGSNFTLTENGALTADIISVLAETGTASIAGSSTSDSFALTAAGDISQTGTIDTTGALDVTSQTGSILMSGATAASSSVAGDITYEAATDIAITSIISTANGTISLTSGAAISDSHASNGTNFSTGGLVTLTAETGIGQILSGDIKTTAGTLELQNLGETGDIVVTETAAGGDLEVIGLTQSATAGWSILNIDDGNLDITGPVLNSGSGSLVVGVNGNLSTSADATVILQGGDLSMGVFGDVAFNASISTNGGDVGISSSGSFSMEPSITLNAGGGNILLQATGDVQLAQVLSALANVRIESTSGSVLRAAEDGRTNVIAANLQLKSALSIGSLGTETGALIIEVDRMTAEATLGVVAINSLQDLNIGASTVTVAFAQVDKSTASGTWNESRFVATDGNAVLQGQGSITVETITIDPTFEVNGNLLLSAQNDLTLNGDTDLSGGSAQMTSGGDFNLNGDLELSGTGTLLLEAGGNFTQADDSSLTTTNLDAIIAATDTLTISQANLGTGDLALTAGGAIIRPSTAPATQLEANFIRLQSGANIGSVANPLVLDAVRISAAATSGIRLNSVGDVDVDSVEVVADQVSTLGAADTQHTESAQSDIASSSGGDVLLDFGGHLTLRDGNADARAVATNGGGRLFITAASIDAYADVRTLNGDLTLEILGAAHWIAVPESAPSAGDATVAAVRSQTGDVYITTGSNFLMDAGTSLRSISGNIGIDVTGNFTVGSVDAAAGYVHVSVSGAIFDGGDTLTDFIADRLQLEAASGAGLLGAATYNALEINANLISARIQSGPLALIETNSVQIGLTTGTVGTLDVDGVASTAIETTAARYGFESLGGGSVTLVAGGSITTLAAPAATPTLAAIRVAGAGNLLLHANASGASVILQGDITLTQGSLTLSGTNGVSTAADVTVETGSNGTINVFATVGGLTMAAGSTLSAVNGDVVVGTAGTISIAGIETGGRVALTSTAGSILDNEAARVNVTATSLRLNANGSVGASLNALDTQVATLSGRTTAGSVYLKDAAGGLSIGSTQASSQVIAPNGVSVTTAVAALSGLVTGGTSGTIVVTLAAGDLTVLAGHVVTAAGSGRILLNTPGELDIQAAVSSTSGSISLIAANDVLLASAIQVTTGLTGQIYLDAGGALLSEIDSRFVASTGNVTLKAADNLILGGVLTEGRAALISDNGHIRAAGSTAFNHEVRASQLLLSAADLGAGGIGTLASATPVSAIRTQVGRLAATAGLDGIHVIDADGLSVGLVVVTNSLVLADGTLQAQADLSLSDLTTVTDGASIVLRTLAGSVTLNEGGDLNGAAVVAAGSGNILISAADTLSANADVLSTSGHITLRAVNNYTQAAAATVETSTLGTIYIDSTSGAVTMSHGALVKTDASVRIEAQNTITLARVEAADASVISEAGAIGAATGSTLNLQVSEVRLDADTGIGSGSAPISLDADSLAASTRAGGVFLLEADGIDVVQNLSVTISEVDTDATVTPLSDAGLSGLTTEVNGSIVLVATLGAVSIDSGAPVSAATSGRILIKAADSISVFDDVTSGSGHITLDAGNGLALGASVTVSTGAADIFLAAGSGTLTQAPTVTVSAGNNVRLAATGDVTLGTIAGQSVSVLSSANIFTAAGVTTNISATGLRLNAGSAIGTGSAHLQLSVAQLAAVTQAGGIYLTEANNITVTSVTVSTNKVTNTAGVSVQADTALADLRTGDNGQVVLVSKAGSITLSDGNNDGSVIVADGNGDILVDASVNVTANADISSGNGHIALRAGSHLALSSIDVTTGTGDISLTATAGAITMPGSALITSTSGVVRASGFTGVTLGQLSGVSASLVAANGAIQGAELSTLNVIAGDLRISANGAVGSANRHIKTNVTNVSAKSVTGAVFLSETSGLNVTSVRVAGSRIDSTGSEVSFVDAAQSDVVANGSVVLLLTAGDLVLQDGNAGVNQTSGDGRSGNGQSVVAGTTGGILLRTLSGNLTANASVLAGTGSITLRASGSVAVNGSSSVETSGAGDLSIEAVQGTLTMAAGTSVSGDDVLRLAAGGNLTIGSVVGNAVSLLSANGAILGFAGSGAQVDATNLRLAANLSIGSSTNALRTDAAVLSARSSTGSIYLSESSATTVSSVRVATNEFTATAGSTTVVDAAQSDLITLNGGDIILVVTGGGLTVNDGSGLVDQLGGDGRSSDGVAVSANGVGRVLLSATGALNVNADVVSTSGLLTLTSTGAMSFAAGVDVSTEADVSLRTTAGSILMQGTTTVNAEGATLRVDAAGALTLGNLQATMVSLLSTGAVTNASGSSLNVDANSLRIESLGSVGVGGRHISTDVATLTAQTGGNLFVTNLSSVLVGPASATVTEFVANSSTTEVIDAELDDLAVMNNSTLVLKTLTGGIEVPNVTALGSGSIVLDAAGALIVNGLVNGGSGAVTLVSQADLTFAAGSSLTTTSNDSVYIASTNGALTMAGDATLDASNAAVRLRASGNLTLGQVTGQLVSLVSAAGAVIDQGTAGETVIADELRISVLGTIGSSVQALRVEADVVAIAAGSVYLQAFDDTVVGTVGGTFNRVISDGTSVVVTDTNLTGIVSSGLIDLETIDGDLELLATVGVLTATGDGSINVQVDGHFTGNAAISSGIGAISVDSTESFTMNANVTSTSGDISMVAGLDLRLINGVDVTSGNLGQLSLESSGGVIEMNSATDLTTGSGDVTLLASGHITVADITTTGAVSLTSENGSIINAGGAANTLIGDTISLTAVSGIGRTGAGTLNIDATSLTVVNNTGSVYLNSQSELNLAGLTQSSFGDLYFRQVSGGLTVSGDVLVASGRAIWNVAGDMSVNSDLQVGDDLRITATSLTMTDGNLISDEGDITIRTIGNTTLDATSSATATLGTIRILSGGVLSVGDLTAGVRVDLRADGSILRTGGEIDAPAVRLFSENGDLGEQLNPLFTNAGRIDLSADGSIYISEAGGFEIGRAGLNGGGDGVDEIIELNFGSGTFSSITGVYEFDGAGTFVLNSSGDLELGTLIRANSGNITISANSLQDGTADEGLLLEVKNGRLSIVTTNGVGGAGAADIDLAAKELTATTTTGDVQLEITGDVRVVGNGIKVTGGSGTLSLYSASGALNVDAPILHGGSGLAKLDFDNGNITVNSLIRQTGTGNLLVRADNGTIFMTSAGRMNTNSGLLDIRASGNITLSRIESATGNIFISSSSGSVRRLDGFANPHIKSTTRAVIEVATIAQFTLDANSVTVNGSTFFRGTGSTYISIQLVYN